MLAVNKSPRGFCFYKRARQSVKRKKREGLSTGYGRLLAAALVLSRNAAPQQMAAHIRTAFLSRFEPITAIAPSSGTVSRQIILSHAVLL